MYLEISPRRSGKTTRLIKDVMNFTQDGRQAAIVVQSARMIDYIHKLMREYKPLEWFARRVSIITDTNGDLIKYPFERVYFDEFDFMNLKGLVCNDTWYYATTPSKLRQLEDILKPDLSDPLIKLLVMNKMQWTHYPAPAQLFENSVKSLYSMDSLLTEVMGVFIKPEKK